jgi:anti-anti-sigma regulatory factor
MFWREQGAGDESTVRFKGVLDATSARHVREFLGSEESEPVVLEFTQASEIDYYGLSVLVAEVAQSGRAVLLRGLHANHVRMLRYFGVDPGRFGITDTPYLDVG